MSSSYPAANAATPAPAPARWRWPVLAVAFVGAWLGASQLEFLCDDAFITFRYVANAHDGHGLVWNREPFLPVEGFTGFSGALCLWAAWSWFGVEPPASANAMSMVLGLVQVAIVAAAALRLRARDGARLPDGIGLLALLVVVGNRTFLQWFTGGLETALCNVGFVGWVVWAFRRERGTARWLMVWSMLAALTALTRPDGLLLVLATAAVAMFERLRSVRTTAGTATGLAPLLAVVAHVGWRRVYYGEWLPNTYHAKIVAAWPEAGLRYLATFVLEHGTWIVAGVAVVWLVVEHGRRPTFLWRVSMQHTPAVAAVAAVVFHAGYYVLKVGGDHFEYRVFSQLVPLSVLATAAMAARLGSGRIVMVALLLLGAGSSVGWLHFAWTRDMPAHGFVAIAERLPAALQPLGRWYDRQQAWLRFHNIGLRCRHHAMILADFARPFPTRLSLVESADAVPVFGAAAVGMVGWSLPDVAVVDLHGLNDWVVARTPVYGGGPRVDRSFLTPVIDGADADRDGWLDRAELRAAVAAVAISQGADPAGSHGPNVGAEFMVAVLFAMQARQRPDAMTRDEALGIADIMLGARSMAHERHPPPGYLAELSPNVVFADGSARALPRAVPLTVERVREVEQKWRQKARDGTLLVK